MFSEYNLYIVSVKLHGSTGYVGRIVVLEKDAVDARNAILTASDNTGIPMEIVGIQDITNIEHTHMEVIRQF